jgi:hypothetical protein
VTGNPFLLLGLLALLFLGAWGWGWAAVGVLKRVGWETADDELGPPMQVLLGMALFLSVGGFLVALDVAKFGVLLAWHVIGVTFLVVRGPALLRRAASVGVRTWLRAAAMAVVGIVLVGVALGQAMGIQLYNTYDDDAAYIYLAKRLLGIGGLADPFNLRRITSYGGSALYQSLFLQTTGNSSPRGFELIFAVGVLLVVAVGTIRRRWVIIGTVLLGIGLILGRGIGPITNLSPEFSVAALSLGVYVLLRGIPLRPDRDQPLRYVVIGVLLAGILALRFYYLMSVVAAAVFVIVALRGRRSLRGLLTIVVSSTIATIGWAVALARSSGTPLFPLILGNYNKSWPSGNDPTLHGIGGFARHVINTFEGYSIGWVCVLAVLTGTAYLVFGREEPARAIVVLGAGLGCLVQMSIVSVALDGSAPDDVIRFNAPSTLACGLLVIDVLWPLWRPHLSASSLSARAHRVATSQSRSSPARLVTSVPVRVALMLCVAAVAFGPSVRAYAHGVDSSLHQASNVLSGTIPLPDRYTPYERDYDGVNSLVPYGAKVLAAVDRPALLDYSTYTFATLDFPGAVSPAPHMPFFQGADAKVAYLRHLGYTYIASESPSQPGLYYFRYLVDELRSPQYFFREQAPYNIDWQSTVTSLENSGKYTVRTVGELSLIRIG